MAQDLPRYDTNETYLWNYENAPSPRVCDVVDVPGDWRFCGMKVPSPLGIAAGPLLNGNWCLYYASLGFDVLTYKTVRSRQRDCYPLPNLQPVACDSLSGRETRVVPTSEMRGSWAVSFGMPSSDPEIWRRDVEWTRQALPRDKVLAVSVVGSIEAGWTMEELAEDYALCARWAMESGADCVETNFSCPNVSTCDGQLYQDPTGSRLVAKCVRAAIGEVPLLIKIGHLASVPAIRSLLRSVADVADGLVMTNSIATTVGLDDHLLFDSQQRGICGEAIRDASVQQVREFRKATDADKQKIHLIGVGGISNATHVKHYLDAGANACQLASAAMTHPEVGLEIRQQLARG